MTHHTLRLPVLIVLLAPMSSILPAAEQDSNSKRPRPKITISKETTYIIRPLREDGSVDYVAAINERCSKGVTPENNAAIPFWRAVGPKEIKKGIRKRYFELLGIPELPEKGEYLISIADFVPLYKEPKPAMGETSEQGAVETQLELAREGGPVVER